MAEESPRDADNIRGRGQTLIRSADLGKSTCLTPDCKRPIERREWCNAHYRRLLNVGKLPPRTGKCGKCGETFPGPKAGSIPPNCDPCSRGRSTCVGCGGKVPRKRRPNGSLAPAPKYCSEDCKPRCSIKGCEEPERKRGWCSLHYNFWYEHGDPHYEPSYKLADKWECKTCGNTDRSTWRAKRRQFCSETCKVTWQKYDGDIPYSFRCAVCDVEVPYFDPITRKRRRIESGYCDEHKRVGREWHGAPEATVEQLAAEDGLLCNLCGDGVDLNLEYPHKLSPSIDHVIPVSRGGGNERENLALTHLTCNISKGNRYIG